jgi:hypothetical protein
MECIIGDALPAAAQVIRRAVVLALTAVRGVVRNAGPVAAQLIRGAGVPAGATVGAIIGHALPAAAQFIFDAARIIALGHTGARVALWNARIAISNVAALRALLAARSVPIARRTADLVCFAGTAFTVEEGAVLHGIA